MTSYRTISKALNNPFFAKSQTITRPSNTTAYTAGDVITGNTVTITGTTSDVTNPKVITGISETDIAKCYPGQIITGTGIAADTNIVSVSTTSITVTKDCTAAGTVTLTLSGQLIVIDLATNLIAGADAATPGKKLRITEAFISCSNGAATTKLTGNLMLFNAAPYATTYADNSALVLSQAEFMSKFTTAVDAMTTVSLCGGTYMSRQSNLNHIAHLNSDSTKLYGILLATNAGAPASAETIIVGIKGFLI